MRIYLSSTFNDLKQHRETVIQSLRRAGDHVVNMEDYAASDQRPLDKCRADIAACDVSVVLIAWRYGYVPPGETKSITELEFREAVQRKKGVLAFLLHEDADWPKSRIDRDLDP